MRTARRFRPLCERIWILRHERGYTVHRGDQIKHFLKTNENGIFLMQVSDIERTAFFIYSIVKHFYRIAYLRAFKGYTKHEKIVFIIEESQNVFDSSTISKKLYNRLRKIFSVARNLGLHFVMCSQRLQDLNTKVRGRTRLMLGQISLDDYELKVHRILRHSRHRKDVLEFAKGVFLYTPLDKLVKFDIFKPSGKPYPYRPLPKPITTEEPKGIAQRIRTFLTKPLFEAREEEELELRSRTETSSTNTTRREKLSTDLPFILTLMT